MSNGMETIKKLDGSLCAARRIGTPLVAIHTPDPAATMRRVLGAFAAQTLPGPEPVMVGWDAYHGLAPLVEGGDSEAWVGAIEEPTFAPVAAIDAALKTLPANSVLFMVDLSKHLGDPVVVASLRAVRDAFKTDRRMLVVLGPGFTVPAELEHDVSVYEEPLPDRAMLAAIVNEALESASAALEVPITVPPETYERVLDALTGLSAFAAEQVAYLTLTPTGFDLAEMWRRKKATIENTPGLKFSIGGDTLDSLGGLAGWKLLAKHVFGGKNRPKLVIRIDEIEKHLAGLGVGGGPGDNTGVTHDVLNVLLRSMEGFHWKGAILVGPPGTAKTAATVCMGATYDVPTLEIDIGATKKKELGESERTIRDIIRVAHGIGGSNVFVCATSNKLDVLPPELIRRFKSGIWYFPLPTDDERKLIWPIQLAAHGLPLDADRPIDTDWTGADIRNCCEAAADYGISLIEAAEAYATPVATIDPEAIEALEAKAHGRWHSASTPGKKHVMRTGRKFGPVGAKRGIA